MSDPTRQQQRAHQRDLKKKVEQRDKMLSKFVMPALPPSDRLNNYRCPEHDNITIERLKGNTPIFIRCPQCGKPAVTSWNRVDPDLVPAYEWIQPDAEMMQVMPIDMLKHLATGGLYLRKIETP